MSGACGVAAFRPRSRLRWLSLLSSPDGSRSFLSFRRVLGRRRRNRGCRGSLFSLYILYARVRMVESGVTDIEALAPNGRGRLSSVCPAGKPKATGIFMS